MPSYTTLSGEARKSAFKTHVLKQLRKGRTPKKQPKKQRIQTTRNSGLTLKSLSIHDVPKSPIPFKKRSVKTTRKLPLHRTKSKSGRLLTIVDHYKSNDQKALEIIEKNRKFVNNLTLSELRRQKQAKLPKRERRVQFVLPHEVEEEERRKTAEKWLQKYDNGQVSVKHIAKELNYNKVL